MVAKKMYPLEQNVTCAYCGTPAVRVVEVSTQRKNLHYCNDECRVKRRKAVYAGDMVAIRPTAAVVGKKKEKRVRIEDLAHLNPTRWELAL